MEIVLEIFVIILSIQVAEFILFNMFAFWASRRPAGISKAEKSSFKIALVIPCYNEERVITEKLDNSFNALSFNNESNVYVLDDGSTDNTFKLAEEYSHNHNLENLLVWKNLGGKGKGKALNWIFDKINADIIVVTDADALLQENSIRELISNFNDPSVGAVTGKIVTRGQSNTMQKEEGMYRNLTEMWRKAESNLDSCSVFNGPLMAIRGELVQQFKIDTSTNCDDICIAYKVRRLGYRAVYEPKALVTEYISKSAAVRARQEIRRGRGLTRRVIQNTGVLGRFGYFGKIIYPFSLFNYILSPFLTVVLLILLPFIMMKFLFLLLLLLLLLIPTVRIAIFGYLYRELSLFIALFTPSKISWKTQRG
jgi:cellulose synthase/poly-beta-1,6-N-acetylglucosamine synthase-like glycosyltransferase